MNNNHLKGALYLRVSTTVQDESSQEQDLIRQAQLDGVEIVKVFRDKQSGLKDETQRQGLNQLLTLEKSDIDIIYFWEISRLSRKPPAFDRLLATFKEREINVCFVKPQLLYLFDLKTGEERLSDTIALSIFSKFALHEIEQKNARSKRGKQSAIFKDKRSYTSKPPYGYKVVDKKLLVNNDKISEFDGFKSEAEVVETIFKMYVSGNPLTSIKKTLNEHRLTTRTHSFQKKDTIKTSNVEKDVSSIEWGRRSIHNILKNTVYYGKKDLYSTKTELVNSKSQKVRYKTGTIDVPAIITEELFLQVQEQMKKNISVANKSYKNEFLLRGFLKCGECGKYYLGTGSKGKNYYHCADRTHRRGNNYLGCKNASMTLKIDGIIWDSIKALYETQKIEETTKNNLANLKETKVRYEEQIALKQETIKLNENKQDNISGHLANITPSAAQRLYKSLEELEKENENYKHQIESLKLKIAFVDSQIEAINKGQDTKLKIENIDGNFQLKSEAIKELISEIYITKTDVAHRVIETTLKNSYYFILVYNWNKQKYVELPDNLYSFDRKTKVFKSTSYNVDGYSLHPIIRENIDAKTVFQAYIDEAIELR